MIREIGIDVGSYTFDKVAKTITLAGIPTIDQSQIILITHAPTSTVIYNFADGAATWGSYVAATGVLTLTYNTNTGSFSNTDPLRILIDNMDMDWYDAGQDVKKMADQSPLWTRRTDVEAIIASAQTLTTSFANLWPQIDCRGYTNITFWIKCTVQQSTWIQIKFLAAHTYGWTESFTIPVSSVNPDVINVSPEILQFPDWVNFLYPITVTTNGTIPYLTAQVKMSIDGGTDGTIDTAYCTKSY